MNKLKMKVSVTLVVLTLLNFTLLVFSKKFLGDSVDRFFVRDIIITSMYFLAMVTLTSLILLFFSDHIFNIWLKKFMIWFAPLAILVIAAGSTEVSYGFPTRTSLALTLGGVLVVVTLIFALVQRFYYQRK